MAANFKNQVVKGAQIRFIFILVVAAATAAPASAQQPKVIKDPAEYNAYIQALNAQDPVQKAALMEAFLQRFPRSVVTSEALEQAMAAYQMAGNAAKLEDVARRLVAVEPDNVRALAVLAMLVRSKGSPETAMDAGVFAERGLAALVTRSKPEGMTDADFAQMQPQLADIFYGAAGYSYLQLHDYKRARDSFAKALAIDANNMQDVYQAGIAELSLSPMDLTGFWHLAKAISLEKAQNNATAAAGVEKYARAQYVRYHGTDGDWDAFVAEAAKQSAPPALAVLQTKIRAAAQPHCDLAVKAVKENPVDNLSIADWEFILARRDCSPENKEAAEMVWQEIQDKQRHGAARFQLRGVKVVLSTGFGIDVAVAEDNQEANRADLRVLFETVTLKPPPVGSMVDVTGVITEYTPHPFMMTMEQATVSPSTEGSPK